MAIHYFEESVKSGLKDKRKLSAFLKALVARHLDVKTIDLNYIFCDDAYLLEKNRQFLNHDTLTDIITFDLSAADDELVSEIYISVERVAENAGKFKVSYNTELHRVIFHGVLHLCGFKDKSAKDKALMRDMEQQCLEAYFTEQ
ncbi:rRNA maturation RNase YbeY [Taibaiella chishuiensis]|uniref:Endoribonuclease YbeY n=1 Tax=Taibaiella chishuiensis TaxID=1434707 RepID=A0A2P8DAP5_9BACT|nr:rRNA maturation RNase YbeY [Taibaiella chishuiensis]PSK94279.1 rRNA maturation RNase YbeY [Taibaiella chishuiensis]